MTAVTRNRIGIQVWRREFWDDSMPSALDFHKLRGNALHECLDDAPGITATDWGDTDDEEPHESVRLILELDAASLLPVVGSTVAVWFAHRVKNVLDEAVEGALKGLVQRLLGQQKQRKLADTTITLPGNSLVFMTPHEDSDRITLRSGDDEITVDFDDITGD